MISSHRMLRGARRLSPWILAAIFLTAAGAMALDYAFLVFEPRRDNILARRRETHRRIIDHTHNDPERYRVLVPFALEPPIRALARVMPYEKAFDRVYAVFYVATLTAILWSLFAYLRRWFSETEALVGSLVVASTMTINLKEFYLAWSLLEPIFTALVLLWAMDGQRFRIAVLLAVAAFNRETALFLVMLYLAVAGLGRRDVVFSLACLAMVTSILVGIRLWTGLGPRFYTVSFLWQLNRMPVNYWITAAQTPAFLGAFWLFAALGWRHAPSFIRRSAIIVPPYVLAFAIWGLWHWTRAWMTLYPIFVPLALCHLFVPRDTPLLPGQLAS